MFRIIALCAVCAALAACAATPQTYHFEKSREYARSYDQIWAGIMEQFTSNNLQIKTIEKESGIIYAEQTYSPNAKDFETAADCGLEPGNIPNGRGVIGLNIFVVEKSPDHIRVTVNTRFQMPVLVYAVIANVPEDRECNSKGVIERRFLDQLENI